MIVFTTKLMVLISGIWGLQEIPINRITVRAFIMIMLAYSAIKNRAKGPAEYSTLKPETSSDSPSVKSNGARLVSAKVDVNHIIIRGHIGKISHRCSCVVAKAVSVKDPFISTIDKIIVVIETS